MSGFEEPRLINREETAGTYALFFKQPVQNNFKTKQEGRPIFEEQDYIRIVIPANKLESPVRPVRDEDKEKWPREWARYQRGEQEAVEGTPLDALTQLSGSRKQELKALNIHTVEHLAAVGDQNLMNMGMGARQERDAAKAFLAMAKDQSAFTKLTADNEYMRGQIELMQERLDEALALIDELKKDKAA